MCKFERGIYPLTITRDRYNGAYSKGKYLAFNLDPDDVPTEITADDVDCHGFWLIDADKYKIGKGDTVLEALKSLCELLTEEERGWEEL